MNVYSSMMDHEMKPSDPSYFCLYSWKNKIITIRTHAKARNLSYKKNQYGINEIFEKVMKALRLNIELWKVSMWHTASMNMKLWKS